MKVATVEKNSLGPRLVSNFRQTVQAVKGVPSPVRWAFLLLVFSLPYEYADLGFISGSSAVKIPGLLFLGAYFVFYGVSGKRMFGRPPRALWWFLLYAVIFGVNAILDPMAGGFVNSGIFTTLQLIVLLWLISDVARDETVARRVLLTYAIATALLAIGMLAGVPGFSTDIGEGRLEAIGDNANAQGQHMALSCIILLGFTLNRAFKRLRTKVLLLPLALVLMAGMVASGSRSAVGAFIIGCMVFLLPHWRSKRILVSFCLAILGLGAAIYMVSNNPDFMLRWKGAYYEGDTAGRDEIYGNAIDMIYEKPMIGWHPVSAHQELGVRVGWPGGRDSHNLVLDLMLGVGILGTIPFLIGAFLCVCAAWKGAAGALGLLPFALIVANLTASMAHTNLTSKPQWLVFGISVAAASSVLGARRSPVVRVHSASIEPAMSLQTRYR